MFTLESRENPLAQFGYSAANTLVGRYLQNQESDRINKSIHEAFEDISPETSSLDVVRKLAGLNVPQQYKDALLHGFGQIQQQKESSRKQLSSQQSALDLEKEKQKGRKELEEKKDILKQNRNEKLLSGLGISPEDTSRKQSSDSLQNISDDELAKIAVQNPQLAQILEKRKESQIQRNQRQEDIQRRKFEADRAFESKRSEPILKKNDEIRASLPVRNTAREVMKKAIQSGKVGSLKDYLADVTGIEPLRSNEGSVFKTASKEYFLRNLARAGARPNQWIEQQIADAQAKFGRNMSSNLNTIALMEFEDDIDAKRSELIDDIASSMQSEQGYVSGDVSKIADTMMKPYVEQRQSDLAYEMRKNQEQEDPKLITDLSKVTLGTPLTVEKAQYLLEEFGDDAMSVAKKLGYSLPNESTLGKYPQ
jgi:hypothetical protein